MIIRHQSNSPEHYRTVKTKSWSDHKREIK